MGHLAQPAERAILRITAALSARPRLVFGLVLAGVTLILLTIPDAPAFAKDKCGGGFSGALCSGSHHIGLGGLWDTADDTMDTINALSPQNFLDTWAQGLTSSVVFILAFIEGMAEKLSDPAYDQQWWASQYAVSFGLAIIVLAFLMVAVTTRIGASSDGSVSGVELLRQSGWRIIFVIPACAAGPAVLYSLQQLAAALTKTFATQSEKDAHGAIGELMRVFKEQAGNWGDFGGTILVIFMMVFVLLTAIVLLVEMAVANWGLSLAGLILPFALVAAVYPPWSRILRRLATLILGLMFVPVAIFFFFWTVWSALESTISGGDESNSAFSLVLFLLVSLIMIDAFPFVAAWLMSLATGNGVDSTGDLQEATGAPSGGELYARASDRVFNERARPSSGEGGGDGAGGQPGPDSGPDDADGGAGPGDTGTHGSSDPGGSSGAGGGEGAAAGGEGAAAGAATGAEGGAAVGAEAGAAAGVEGGPPGMVAGAAAGTLVGTGVEVADQVEKVPDEVHDAGDHIISDTDEDES